MKTSLSIILSLVCAIICVAEEQVLRLDVYTLPMSGFYEVRAILTNCGSSAITVPSKSYTGYPDASGTGNGRASYFIVIGFGEVGKHRLVPSPERFFPVTLEPGESTALPMIECSLPDVTEIKIVYVVDEDYARRQGWWHGEIATSVVPGKEAENPYVVDCPPTPIVTPPEPNEKAAQPGATDNPDDAQ